MVASKKFGSKVQLNYLASGDISYYIVYKISDKTIFKKVGKKSEGINETKCINLRNQIPLLLFYAVLVVRETYNTSYLTP